MYSIYVVCMHLVIKEIIGYSLKRNMYCISITIVPRKYHEFVAVCIVASATSLLPSVLLRVLRTRNNTDGNKQVIFFPGI